MIGMSYIASLLIRAFRRGTAHPMDLGVHCRLVHEKQKYVETILMWKLYNLEDFGSGFRLMLSATHASYSLIIA